MSRATAIASGTRASPTPWRVRPTTRPAKPTGSAASTVPTRTTPSPPKMTGRRKRPVPRRPITGVATAPAIRVEVSAHCAPVSGTSYRSAMLGTSGAPRLLTTAVTVVSSTRLVSSWRWERGGDMVGASLVARVPREFGARSGLRPRNCWGRGGACGEPRSHVAGWPTVGDMELQISRPRVVVPVRVDPAGVRGPTPDQARGRRWRRTSPGRYVPASVAGDTLDRVDQRIVEVAAGLPAGAGVTGWAALHWQGARYLDAIRADGGVRDIDAALARRGLHRTPSRGRALLRLAVRRRRR